jgi:phytoene/squalene synthetase
MVMLAALEEFGVTEDDVFENDCDNAAQRLWNEAWDIARAAGFYI